MVKHWMESHPFSVEQPGFKFTIIGAFKDCLSRQVAEAMKIYYSTDNLLNSKNEYLSNNISRVTVDIDKYERKKKELEEEKRELEASRMFENFKFKNRVHEKRGREEENANHQEANLKLEPNMKRRRKDSGWLETQCELDLGTWLAAAEARCERAGQIRSRIERESERVLKLMNERESKKVKGDHNLPVGEVAESEALQAGWKNSTHIHDGEL